MTENRPRIRYLLSRYADDSATSEERKELLQWIDQSANSAQLENFLLELLEGTEPAENYNEEYWNAMIERITGKPEAPVIKLKPEVHQLRRRSVWPRIAAAAAIVLIAAATYFFTTNDSGISRDAEISERYKNDINPGTRLATLSIANGQTLNLNSSSSGQYANPDEAQLLSYADGLLAYQPNPNTSEFSIHTVSTPRGGEYSVQLSDGTKVWLNASSSLRFPTAFNEDERLVELVGEAYFEVAKNANKPFRVYIPSPDGVRDGALVEVLGTHFNINAYANEKEITTTLLEGSVKVYSKVNESSLPFKGDVRRTEGTDIILSPGNKATINATATLKTLPDDGTAIAWKDGLFMFEDCDIQTIMRQAARWYDIEIAYDGDPTEDTFTGSISRSVNLSQLLKMLEYSDVRFIINGRKITVMP